jgi:hypothetical protein
MCNKFVINKCATEQLQIFEANFLYTVEHGVASSKTKSLHKLHQTDLILMDTGDRWIGCPKMSCKLAILSSM